jgi:hypothetical protein
MPERTTSPLRPSEGGSPPREKQSEGNSSTIDLQVDFVERGGEFIRAYAGGT